MNKTRAKPKQPSPDAQDLFKGAEELCVRYMSADNKETPAVIIAACLRRLQHLSAETNGEYNGAIMQGLAVSLQGLIEAEFT